MDEKRKDASGEVMKKALLKRALPAIAIAAAISSGMKQALANQSVEHSLFGEVAQEAGVDPLLLYSVALTESAHKAQGGVSPHPYALRVASQPGVYPSSRKEAAERLDSLLDSYTSVDVGLMQVNLRWHGHRVDSPHSLLDPRTNLRVGAEILSEAMASTSDPYVGIGRYYTWSDNDASRRYGERVLHFYRQLKASQ